MVHILEEIEAYAKERRIPIMEKEGILFLTDYIKKHKVKKILEIGSAIGYSAIKMALVNEDVTVVTLEKDEERYQEALFNIKRMNLEDRIKIYHTDALLFDTEEKFDLLFIDAAKGKYISFFEKFKDNVKEDGTIISDNLGFHGLVGTDTSNYSRNVRGIVRKLEKYITFLNENKEFQTTFIKKGDGIGITIRNKEER